MSHTPEPWQFIRVNTSDGFGGTYGQAMFIGGVGDSPDIVCSGYGAHATSEDLNITDDDAARIVACVNACTGLNPEAVPDLLAACKAALELFDGPDPGADCSNWPDALEARKRWRENIETSLRSTVARAEANQ